MRGAIALGYLAVGLLLPACEDESLIDGMFTQAEWQKINTFSPLPAPPPSPTNRFADDLAVAELGQRLWFEKRYAGPILQGSPDEGGLGVPLEEQKVSCADCHDPERWFTDTRSKPNATSLGTARTRRNAPSIVNAVFYDWGNWGGGHDQFWRQAANLPEAREVFNSDRLRYAHNVYVYYRDHYNRLFDPDLDSALDPAAQSSRFPASGKPALPGEPPGPWEGMLPSDQDHVDEIMANCGKAIEAYERLLVSRDAPLDRYVAGDFTALGMSAKRGLKLFVGKAGCDSCHKDQTFTDQEFHNTGVPQVGELLDDGRFSDVLRLPNVWNGAGEFSDDPEAGRQKLAGVTQTSAMTGQFRTKSLRHIAETGPYFHNGSFASLADVVRFYNIGGGTDRFPGTKDDRLVPLNLSESEISDLVELLRSLTGEPVPPHLTINTAATDPVL